MKTITRAQFLTSLTAANIYLLGEETSCSGQDAANATVLAIKSLMGDDDAGGMAMLDEIQENIFNWAMDGANLTDDEKASLRTLMAEKQGE